MQLIHHRRESFSFQRKRKEEIKVQEITIFADEASQWRDLIKLKIRINGLRSNTYLIKIRSYVHLQTVLKTSKNKTIIKNTVLYNSNKHMLQVIVDFFIDKEINIQTTKGFCVIKRKKKERTKEKLKLIP